MVRGDSSGDRERLGIGSANQILQSDGSDPAWATLSTAASVLTTQGDILYEGAAGLARLGQSTDGHVLTTKGAAANPVWAAAAGGGKVSLVDNQTAGVSDNTLTGTFTAIDLQDTTCAMIIWKGAFTEDTDIMLRWNGITSGTYSGNALYVGSNNTATTVHASQDHIPVSYKFTSGAEASPNLGFCGVAYLYSYLNTSSEDVIQMSHLTQNVDGYQNWQATNTTTSETALDEFTIYLGASANFTQGSQYTVYKIEQ